MAHRKRVSMTPLIAILLVTTICIGQASRPTKKANPKPSVSSSSFSCPDDGAKQACKSYDELLKAKDTSLPNSGYICFRRDMDEFFVISFFRPYFAKHWDQDLKAMVTDTNETQRGFGSVSTYKNGIEESGAMPALHFSGKWYAYTEGGLFKSDKINLKEQDDEDSNVGIVIDAEQFNAGYKYKNRRDKTVTYRLTVQLSTGRFTETFHEESEPSPFLEGTGRCIYQR